MPEQGSGVGRSRAHKMYIDTQVATQIGSENSVARDNEAHFGSMPSRNSSIRPCCVVSSQNPQVHTTSTQAPLQPMTRGSTSKGARPACMRLCRVQATERAHWCPRPGHISLVACSNESIWYRMRAHRASSYPADSKLGKVSCREHGAIA